MTGEQSRRELAPGGATTRARVAAVQISRIRPAFPEHACCRPQHLQPSTPPHLSVDPPDLPNRGDSAMAERDHHGMIRTPLHVPSRLKPLNLTMRPIPCGCPKPPVHPDRRPILDDRQGGAVAGHPSAVLNSALSSGNGRPWRSSVLEPSRWREERRKLYEAPDIFF